MQLIDNALHKQAGFLNGEWVEAKSGDTMQIENPANGELIGTVPNLGVDEVRVAILVAKQAQKQWAAQTAKSRSTILMRWYDLIMENQEDLAQIITAEMGKPLAEARGEIAYGASFIQWFAEEAKRVYGETIPGHQPDKRLIVMKQPIGVVAAITPWNFPNAMLTRKVGPALAAGCAVVVKPAPETPFSALALCHLAERAGLPKGLLNVITGRDAAAIGAEMCANPIVRKLSFTGSTEVGRTLMRQSADTVKKLGLELGGNAPFIVFDDADLDVAVEGVMIAKFRNNGQTCVCANRIYVQSAVYDAFAEKLAAAIKNLKVGDGAVAGVTTGPLINERAVEKVSAHIADAVSKGARLVAGGARHELGHTFFQPTILADVNETMQIAGQETFGPVAPLFRFENVDDVVRQANDTIFGLACYFYAQDLSRVWRVAEALEYGMVGVNTGLISTEVAPFGGVKQSGLGREGSRHGIDDYLEMKYLCIGGI